MSLIHHHQHQKWQNWAKVSIGSRNMRKCMSKPIGGSEVKGLQENDQEKAAESVPSSDWASPNSPHLSPPPRGWTALITTVQLQPPVLFIQMMSSSRSRTNTDSWQLYWINWIWLIESKYMGSSSRKSRIKSKSRSRSSSRSRNSSRSRSSRRRVAVVGSGAEVGAGAVEGAGVVVGAGAAVEAGAVAGAVAGAGAAVWAVCLMSRSTGQTAAKPQSCPALPAESCKLLVAQFWTRSYKMLHWISYLLDLDFLSDWWCTCCRFYCSVRIFYYYAFSCLWILHM